MFNCCRTALHASIVGNPPSLMLTGIGYDNVNVINHVGTIVTAFCKIGASVVGTRNQFWINHWSAPELVPIHIKNTAPGILATCFAVASVSHAASVVNPVVCCTVRTIEEGAPVGLSTTVNKKTISVNITLPLSSVASFHVL